jgi:hypothetical protein
MDPLRYLRVGVDPHAEARKLARSLREGGFQIVERIRGRTLSAVGARHPDGDSAVRVVTARGIALALDGGKAPQPRGEVWLVGIEALDGGGERPPYDLDGDGREEIALGARRSEGERACIALVRVGARGRVVEVGTGGPELPQKGCIVDVRDVGAGAAPEALMRIELGGLAMQGRVPAVTIPLAGRDGRWRPARAAGFAGYWRAQREGRRAALREARDALSVPWAHRIGVELAALARFRGRDRSVQVSRFDAALRGLVLSESEAVRLRRSREHIAAGWPASSAQDP